MVAPWKCSILLLCSLVREVDAFVPSSQALLPHNGCVTSQQANRQQPVLRGIGRLSASEGGSTKEDDLTPTSDNPGLIAKTAWYGSELLGNLIGIAKPKEAAPAAIETDGTGPLSRVDALERLKVDFDRFYFVNGQMDLDLYEEDCTFADPFVAFKGRQRFKNNLDNLGSFMQDVNLDVKSWQETESSLKTKWRFRCVLDLPWKPILAASGGTEFFFSSESGRIERHVESWDIKPMDALKQLVRPGRREQKP